MIIIINYRLCHSKDRYNAYAFTKLPDYFEYIENDVSYSLRQVQYPQDIPLLHRWMHEPHVIPQWQLNKSEIELKVYFEKC